MCCWDPRTLVILYQLKLTSKLHPYPRVARFLKLLKSMLSSLLKLLQAKFNLWVSIFILKCQFLVPLVQTKIFNQLISSWKTIPHSNKDNNNNYYYYYYNFISRVLLKQATKKKNERFITRRFRLLMTRLSIFLHLCDCNIIHISLDKGVMRPEMSCYKSFIFLSKLIQPT